MMREEAVRFGRDGSLVGVVTQSEQSADMPAIILLNAGMIHHVGPSRIYVRLARHLVKQGFTSLRFDFSGIGDSCARADNLAIEQAVVDDVKQAMNFLTEHSGVSQFILIGHCAGAWIAFLSASLDERICGTVLMNPDGATDDWVEYDRQRKVSRFYEQYYSKEALFDPQRWKKLLTGKASYRSITNNVMKNIIGNRISTVAFKVRQKLDGGPKEEEPAQQSLRDQIVKAFVERNIHMLLLFSKGSSAIEHTHTIFGQEFDTIMQSGMSKEVIIPNADHTFTLMAGQHAVMDEIGSWCGDFLSASVPQP